MSRLGLFAEVRAAFLKGAAPLEAALEGLKARRIYVVPNLMSGGAFARRVVPGRLGLKGAVTRRGGRLLLYCDPPGLNPGLARLVLARVGTLCRAASLDPGRLVLLLVGHGSSRDPASGGAVRAHARRLAAEGGFADVRVAFLDEAPRLAEVLAEGLEEPCVVVGMFAADGLHGERDVRRALANTGRLGEGLFYTGAIGGEPGFLDLILDEVRKAERRAGLRA